MSVYQQQKQAWDVKNGQKPDYLHTAWNAWAVITYTLAKHKCLSHCLQLHQLHLATTRSEKDLALFGPWVHNLSVTTEVFRPRCIQGHNLPMHTHEFLRSVQCTEPHVHVTRALPYTHSNEPSTKYTTTTHMTIYSNCVYGSAKRQHTLLPTHEILILLDDRMGLIFLHNVFVNPCA